MVYSHSRWLASELARRTLPFCQNYLGAGRRVGDYWLCGDAVGHARAEHVCLACWQICWQMDRRRRRAWWARRPIGHTPLALRRVFARSLRADKAFHWLCAPVHAASRQDKRGLALRFWQSTQPLAGTLAECYLQNRAIRLSVPCPSALRFHPRAWVMENGERMVLPALCVGIADPAGEIQAVQRSFLCPESVCLADMPAPKRLLGSARNGATLLACVPGGSLHIGEGVETMLSVVRLYDCQSVIACHSASNLAHFDPQLWQSRLPPSTLIICVDNDPAGARAGFALARWAKRQDLPARMLYPPEGRNDFNDWLRQNHPPLEKRHSGG